MTISAGAAVWKTAFQTSPILLQGGLAEFMPFQTLPLFAIPELLSFGVGLTGGPTESLADYFSFRPLPGSTIIQQEIGHYPFANSTIAANAIITTPQNISMLMQAPAKGPLGYFAKLAIFVALRQALLTHNERAGTYVVLTPSAIFTNCIMKAMRDITGSEGTKQVQVTWQLDFERPLITFDQLQDVLNGLYTRFTSGTAIVGAPTVAGSAGATPPPSTTLTPAAQGSIPAKGP
jgi:hypothetical protein